MKYVKMMGLAAVAAMAVMAFIGASTASATVLYVYHTPSANTTQGVGTTFLASLTGGTAELTSTSGTLLDTCTGGEVHGDIHTEGSATTTTKIEITSLTWTGCLEPTETSALGFLEIHHIAGTTNGTVTAVKSTSGNASVVKVNTTIFGAVCEYTTGESLDLGELVGAKETTGNATLAINVIVPAKNSFFCPDARWKANYKVTTPVGLMVEAS